MPKFWIPLSIAALLAGVVIALMFISPQTANYEHAHNEPTGGDFTLWRSGNEPVSLSDFKGKVVFLFFGYTYCPDICPTSLALLGAALKKMNDTEREQVQVLFVSVDPERDTLDHLKGYVEHFHPSMIGISGTKDEVDQVVKQYGGSYRKAESDSAAGYLVDHSAVIYALDQSATVREVLPHGTSVNAVLSVVRALLAEQHPQAESDPVTTR